MELLRSDLNINFLGKRKAAYILSLLLVASSLYLWFQMGDSKYGIDYLGGHEIVVKIPEPTSAEAIRKSLAKAGMPAIVQAFESDSGEYSIRMSGDSQDSKIVRGEVEKALSDPSFGQVDVLKTDFVGPTIGKELRKKALIAILVSLIGMLVYISYRFEFAFALGAVVALFHDVVVSMGVYLVCGLSIGVATLAAALTIVGYSVNDTIIIFDRVREEIFRQKKMGLEDLFNYCINQTLSRTIITSLLTFFSAIALLVFGGGALTELSLFLTVGIITGTYSTIFIASPIALAWERFRYAREKKEAA